MVFVSKIREKHVVAPFGLESGMLFEGTTDCMNVFIVLIPNE